jgi:DNA-binding MurR/RpiR family transcriptional regulator
LVALVVVFMNVTAINMKEGDVAIGISHSGRTKAVVDALARAKESGATTVAITSFENAPLARNADYSVCVFADEENYPVEAVSARMAHMCLIDAFTMTLATMEYDEFEKHVTGRNRILEEIRY